MCRLSGSCLVLLAPLLAFAHHGGAEYYLTKTVQFQGKLTHVDLINPHAWIYFDVTDSDGKISHHRCEMRSVHVLRRFGPGAPPLTKWHQPRAQQPEGRRFKTPGDQTGRIDVTASFGLNSLIELFLHDSF